MFGIEFEMGHWLRRCQIQFGRSLRSSYCWFVLFYTWSYCSQSLFVLSNPSNFDYACTFSFHFLIQGSFVDLFGFLDFWSDCVMSMILLCLRIATLGNSFCICLLLRQSSMDHECLEALSYIPQISPLSLLAIQQHHQWQWSGSEMHFHSLCPTQTSCEHC